MAGGPLRGLSGQEYDLERAGLGVDRAATDVVRAQRLAAHTRDQSEAHGAHAVEAAVDELGAALVGKLTPHRSSKFFLV